MSVDTQIIVGDLLRGVSSLLYLVILCQIVNVVYRYAKVLYVEHSIGTPKAGLLPQHVTLLGVALLSMATLLAVDTYADLGDTVSWQTPCIAAALAVTMYGLYLVMSFEYRRYSHAVAGMNSDE